MSIEFYEKDWGKFEKYIEEKTKGRCVISNKNWKKLRDFHLEKFIKTVPHPYGLLFKMIYMSMVHKNIPSIHKIYHKYRKKRQQELSSVFRVKSKASSFRRYR